YLLSFIKEKILRKRIIVSLGVILLSFYILILPHLEHPLYKNKPHVEYERFLSLKEVSNIPYQIWFTNFSQVVLLIFSYATPLVFLIFIAAIFYARKNKKILLPMLFVLGPIIFEILMLRNIDARYLVVSVPVILLVAGNLLEASTLKRKVLTALTLTGVICSGLLLTFFPLKYHQMIYFIPNARNDFAQYVTSWPSGYGVKEAADWLTQKSQEKNMFVFIRDDSGNPEEAMVVYLRKNEKIIVLPVGLLDELYKNRDHLILSDPGFYFVSRGNQLAGMEKRFREVARYPKPQGQEYVGIYEVIK
ncbi:hypothetical protein HY407_01400, partial [Candidatus Gottesmanbacteria bacterium]|nr:hypothetical protein [Candidatus Gottesmanbacteria bacterium]